MLIPILSEAETDTDAEPLKVEPEAGDVMLTVGATLSLTVTVNVTTAPEELVAWTIGLEGVVIIGGELSILRLI